MDIMYIYNAVSDEKWLVGTTGLCSEIASEPTAVLSRMAVARQRQVATPVSEASFVALAALGDDEHGRVVANNDDVSVSQLARCSIRIIRTPEARLRTSHAVAAQGS